MRSAYDEVYVYTMGRPGFILQHVVDAYGAQTASSDSKPIRIVFALVGLYLHVERHFRSRRPIPHSDGESVRGRLWIFPMIAGP